MLPGFEHRRNGSIHSYFKIAEQQCWPRRQLCFAADVSIFFLFFLFFFFCRLVSKVARSTVSKLCYMFEGETFWGTLSPKYIFGPKTLEFRRSPPFKQILPTIKIFPWHLYLSDGVRCTHVQSSTLWGSYSTDAVENQLFRHQLP